jgi:hypothetical protein
METIERQRSLAAAAAGVERRAGYPRLAGLRIYDVTLEPGEIIFMPIGRWHQVKALSFSVTVTFTNFLWPNDAYWTYPGD